MTEEIDHTQQINVDNKRVYTEKEDITLQSLQQQFDEGDIIPQPDYQRDYVYKDKQASMLVESVLMRIPIPPIYVCEEQDGTYSIIDGQQRTTALVKFLKNEFALTGLKEIPELNGKKYKDLSKPTQKHIKSYTLIIIRLLKDAGDLKYEIFSRLNQGAVELTPQELRNCIYRGTFNDMLENIASNNQHIKELFIDEKNTRKRYQENILRFFALADTRMYSSSMKKTMNDFMAKHQNDDEATIAKYQKLFTSTIDIIKQVLGANAFRAYDRDNKKYINKFSGSIYDSVIIPFSMFDKHELMLHADEIRNKLDELKRNDAKYQEMTYAATGSKKRVIGRINMVRDAISDILGHTCPQSDKRLFSEADKQTLWHDGYICSYCKNKILSIDDAEVDHIKPFSLGGKTTLENAQLLHRHCNRAKYNNVDNDYFEEDEDNE